MLPNKHVLWLWNLWLRVNFGDKGVHPDQKDLSSSHMWNGVDELIFCYYSKMNIFKLLILGKMEN